MPALNVVRSATSLTIGSTPLIDAETLRLARYGIVTAAENTATTVMQAALSPFAADVGDGGIFLGVN